MKKTTLLKKLINDPKLLIMPGAYDAISAKLIEKAGFEAVQCTGAGIAASLLGVPDVSIISMKEMATQTGHIANAVDIPVMGDGDTGFGNAVNVYFTVREFERLGAAGINLEDQVFPKRCGHMAGKLVITLEEMVKKIEAAVDAKKDKDFVINARVDAIAMCGVEEAIQRGNAYANAGADLIFVDGVESRDQVIKIIKEIDAPVSINMLEGGRTPIFSFKELEKLGAARASCPLSTMFAAMMGIKSVLGDMIKEGRPLESDKRLETFENYKEFIGMPFIKELESKYLLKEVFEKRYGNYRKW